MTDYVKKLVLFDIDGTLIRHFGKEPDINIGWNRFGHALHEVFGIDVIANPQLQYHGSVDRAILFDIARQYGVTKPEFDAKFEDVKAAVIDYAHTKETSQIYESIPEAVELLKRVKNTPDRFLLGILTGNVDAMARWKLRHVGIDPIWFTLFVTSDEYEDRISLAKSVCTKLEKEANIAIEPGNVIVIGDAVGDVRCAHAIGAKSIIVMTGKHKRDELVKEEPTILVETLMDQEVLTYLGV